MKQIIITFLVFTLSIMSVFAETTLNFTSDKKDYNIEETIQLNIQLSLDDSAIDEMKIWWLDNFQVIAQNESTIQKNINGELISKAILQLSLLAKKSWDYTLWPISVETGSGKVESNILKISVTGERIMVNNQIKTPKQVSNVSEEEENIDDVDLDTEDNTNNSSSGVQIHARKIIWVDWEEMNNIYKDKWFLTGKIFSKNSLIFLIIALTGLIFYIILQKYLANIPPSIPPVKEKIKKKPEINYIKLIQNLEKKYINSDKETFYAQTAKILRTYLDDKVQDWLSKWSLKEVEKFLWNISEDTLENKQKVIDFYKKIYFPEYAPWEDAIQERKNVLSELESIIIKKEFK